MEKDQKVSQKTSVNNLGKRAAQKKAQTGSHYGRRIELICRIYCNNGPPQNLLVR